MLISLYSALIAPIPADGWNNTAFNAGWALAVTGLLAIGIGGSVLGFLWCNAPPSAALLVTAFPAGFIIGEFVASPSFAAT